MCKSGSSHYEIEPLSEFLASQLADVICPAHVTYDLALFRGKVVSKCRLFTSVDAGLAKASAVFGGEEKTLPELMQFFDDMGDGDAFRRMCVLDALILNPDRHYGNFGVMFNTQTMEITGMAPVFDNNRSLLPDLDDDQLRSPDWYIARCRPRLGRDFVLTVKRMMTDDIRRDVETLRDFSFEQHTVIRAEQTRLDALSAIVRKQAARILDG